MDRFAFWTIWVFVFIVPWENTIVVPGVGTAAKISGIIAIAVGSLTLLARGKLRWHPFHVVSLLFVFWSWAGYFWSINPGVTITRVTTYAGLWLMMFAIYQLAYTEVRCRCLMWAYVLGAWVAALGTIRSYVQDIQVVSQRYAASGFNPNDIAIYLSLAIPMAWYLGLKAKRSSVKALAWGLIAVATVAVLLTGSRTGALGCGVALSYVVLSCSRLNWKWRVMSIAGGLAVAILAASIVPLTTFARITTLPYEIFHGTFNERIRIWNVGIRVFTDNPLFGVGSGTFRFAVAPILGAELAPHNAFLAVSVESGLIGLTLWLGMMVTAFKGIFRAPPVKRHMWLALFSILFLALFALNFEWRKPAWLLMIMAVAHARRTTGTLPIERAISS